MRYGKSVQAFTLIELSIVLVIIGLLVGGVLTGRDLIQAAQIRATISQYQKFQTAVNTFQGKYDALPGDLTTAQATMFNMQPTARNSYSGYSNVTPGNGIIEAGYDSYNLGYENVLFWRDLSTGGLIEGSFVTAPSGFVATTTAIDNYIPSSKIRGARWAVANDYGNNIGGGNWYYLGGLSATINSTGNIAGSGSLTPIEAYNIDLKVDDGKPNTGIVVSNNGEVRNYAVMIYDLQSNPDMTGVCAVSGLYAPTGSKYNIDINQNVKACSLNLKF
jgi:prepilin-type N-terminal cleavage/methylation domain-containing protein